MAKYDFKISEEPTYRSFGSVAEFLEKQKLHGPYIQFTKKVYNIPKTVIELDGQVICDFDTPAYKHLSGKELLNYKWQDGTVCGIIDN